MSDKYNGDACLEARVRVLENILEEREKALALAVRGIDARLELLNELRSDVMTKSEYLRAHESVSFRLGKIEATQSRFIGVSLAMMAMSGLVGAVISHLFKT
jgi:hypothetical protein